MGVEHRCGAFAAVMLCASMSAAAAPTIDDFASDTDFASPALSPDGNQVVFVTRVENARLLVIVDLLRRERRGLMPATAETFEITWCDFKTEERLLCGMRGTQFIAGEPYPITRLLSIDATGKAKPKVLIQNSDSGVSQYQDRIADWLLKDPTHVLIQLTDAGSPFPNVNSLDVFT